MNWPTLSNAPITEALIDLAVEFPAPVENRVLSGFGAAMGAGYSEARKRFTFTEQVRFLDAGADVRWTTSEPDGFLFVSADKINVIQARQDGFTFSRLKPYESWISLSHDAHAAWTRYCDAAHPSRVKRVAVRYINRIEVHDQVDIKEFTRTFPQIAPSIPQVVSSVFMRVVIPHPDEDVEAIVTLTTQPGDDTTSAALIFDIDVFRAVDLEPRDSRVWASLDTIREFKNQVFFGSITEKALERYR